MFPIPQIYLIILIIFSFMYFTISIKLYLQDEIQINKYESMRVITVFKSLYLYSVFCYEKEKKIIALGFSKYNNLPKINCAIFYSNLNYENCNLSYKLYNRVNKHFFVINIMLNFEIVKCLYINNMKIQPISLTFGEIYNCTLCITKLINYTAKTYLLEAINGYLLAGIDHIVIYYTSSSKEVYNILTYYSKKFKLEIIKWNYKFETKYMKDYVYGQIWKYNDCFYRYKYKSKYILFNDIDEILWINNNKKIDNILTESELANNDVLYLYNSIFRKEFYSNNKYNNSRIVPYDRYNHNIPDFSMFSYHNYCVYPKGYLTKYIIIHKNKINYLGIHDVIDHKKGLQKAYIKDNLMFLRHTRRVREDLLNDCKNWKNYYSTKEKYLLNLVKKEKKEFNIK